MTTHLVTIQDAEAHAGRGPYAYKAPWSCTCGDLGVGLGATPTRARGNARDNACEGSRIANPAALIANALRSHLPWDEPAPEDLIESFVDENEADDA